MYSIKAHSPKKPSLKSNSRKNSLTRKTAFLSSPHSPTKKEPKKHSYTLRFPSSENKHLYKDLHQPTQTPGFLLDVYYARARLSISLIEDPLWKCVCGELMKMMGPLSVLKIWDSQLGSFSAHALDIDIRCKTEDVAQFVQQYAFVILEGLRKYFPAIKNLKIYN